MPKNKKQKKEILSQLEDKIKKSKSIVFAGFDALGVKDNEALRARLAEEDGEYYVVKKTLLNRALNTHKIEGFNPSQYEGKLAAVFSYTDEVASAKLIGEFKKDKEKTDKITFLGGILEGKLIAKEQVEALSKLPSKQELYAQVVGSLNAPISGFVNVLGANLRSFVTVLQAIADKK